MTDFLKTKEIAKIPEQTPEIPNAPDETSKELMQSRENAPIPRESQEKLDSIPTHQGRPMQKNQVSELQDRVPTPTTKSERLIEIEKIMSQNLEEVYQNLDPQTQEMIKKEGEKTATSIEELIEQGKAIAKGVLGLIRAWLHKIPGMNKFFLEQESKLKTDKIMAIERKTRLH